MPTDREDRSDHPSTDSSFSRREASSDEYRSSTKDLALVAGVAALLVLRGWRRWTHPVVDFGRELYVPWQILEGKNLYQDLAYFNGPLSPYLNALGFQLFGVSLTTLLFVNIVLLAAVTLLLYRLVRYLGDRLNAVVAALLFLAVFATADLIGFGNYNFLTPYSHEMTHGTLLSVLLLLILCSFLESPTTGKLIACGLVLGLISLTKAEFFVAALASLILGMFVHIRRMSSSWVPVARALSVVGAGTLVPPLAAWALLRSRLGGEEALVGVLGSWPYVFMRELAELPFYRKGMGLDAPAENLGKMLLWSGIYLVALGPPFVVAGRLSPTSRHRVLWSWVFGAWAAVTLIAAGIRFDPTDFPRPLPLVVIGAAIGTIMLIRRDDEGDGLATRLIGLFALQIFALALLAKMALQPRFQHYGFALAMPAAICLVLTLLYLTPEWIRRRGGYGPAFRLAGLMFLFVVGLGFTLPSQAAFRQKILPFGQGSDSIFVHQRFLVVEQLLERLRGSVGGDETLLVLPEGVMLNYQIKRLTPTRYVNFMPPEFAMFSEHAILSALQQNPPDVVVLLKRSAQEYGYEAFGSGYGEAIMAWLDREDYRVIETLTDPRLDRLEFGRALILRQIESEQEKGAPNGAPPE